MEDPPPCHTGHPDAPEPLLTTEALVALAHAHRQGIPYETSDQLLERLPQRLRALADLILGGKMDAGEVAYAVAALLDRIEHTPALNGTRPMTTALPPIQPCADLPAIRALLAAAGLPVADLAATPPADFWGCREGTALIGVIGLEPYGSVALLRSLAVGLLAGRFRQRAASPKLHTGSSSSARIPCWPGRYCPPRRTALLWLG